MANRIDSVPGGITPKPTKDAGQSRAATSIRSADADKAAAGESRAAVTDTVVLTERGQRLEQLEKAVSALPVVDRARVDAVKADIASGNYSVDVDNIADILLRTESDFDG